MRSGNRNQQCEEYEEDDFNSSKDGLFSNTSNNITATSTKDKSNDKANAMRSKHSVTEQRRRSKINERFQILRDLIPNPDQKRDTASFLLEVIDYVKYLQEKVEKYEGSYPGWSPEPTKLLPWRNSHWRVPGFVAQPQPMKNGSDSVPTTSGNFEENTLGVPSNVLGTQMDTLDPEPGRDCADKSMVGQETELSKPQVEHIMSGHEQGGAVAVAYPLQRLGPDSSPSMECPATRNILTQHEDFTIEGGTINISSVYSQELLITLTDALHSAGVDLSHANISMQIDLGKRANRGPTAGTFVDNAANGSNHAQKRQKT